MINLSSGIMLNIYKRNESKGLDKQGCIWMEPRSLWVMTEEVYSSYLHGIDDIEEDIITPDINILNIDRCNESFRKKVEHVQESKEPLSIPRDTRYSMTFRIVTKSKKLPSSLFSFMNKK